MSKLILIPTPIGNLDDLTLRAIECIKDVDLILCEDTRRSLKLLNHLQIKKPLKSFHKFNEHSKVEKVIIENSRLGIKADKFDLSDGLKAITWDSKDHEGKWTQDWGEQKEFEYNYGEMLVSLKSNKNAFKMNVRFRLFDDGLGFRYEIPEQDGSDSPAVEPHD